MVSETGRKRSRFAPSQSDIIHIVWPVCQTISPANNLRQCPHQPAEVMPEPMQPISHILLRFICEQEEDVVTRVAYFERRGRTPLFFEYLLCEESARTQIPQSARPPIRSDHLIAAKSKRLFGKPH